MTVPVKHPATFSRKIIAALASILDKHAPNGRILDPFAGVGGVHKLATPTRTTVGVEIEPVWADVCRDTIQGDARALPFKDASFGAIVTSPTYGNRMADSHIAKDGSVRRSYSHDMRANLADQQARLSPSNTGLFYAWNDEYWELHDRAWEEAVRVLTPGGIFTLNTSDFIRSGEVVPVTARHIAMLEDRGLVVVDSIRVATPRMRRGSNGNARMAHEDITIMTGCC